MIREKTALQDDKGYMSWGGFKDFGNDRCQRCDELTNISKKVKLWFLHRNGTDERAWM